MKPVRISGTVFMSDAELVEAIGRALARQRLDASHAQVMEILAYVRAHSAPVYHAISRVLGTPCRCVRCLNGAAPVLT